MVSQFLKHRFALAVALLPLAAQAQRVIPTVVTGAVATKSKYTLTMGNMSFQATPGNSGRIQSVKHSGSEVLHQDTGSATSYGSTFWPSPQAVWNWPPPANIDGNAFTASIDADSSITFVNATADNTTKIRIRKNYWANLTDSSFNYRFTMTNTGAARPWSPWEDTRIDTGGLYLFPKGTDAATGALATYTKDSLYKDSTHIIWYQHNANTTLSSGTNKFYMDGSQGWYAHVYANRLLLIKKFKDSPASKKAPSPEDEIEFYSTNKPLGNTSFIEMEAQGSYDTIKANDSVSWDMKWLVRKLPDSVNVTMGNPAIVAYVLKVVSTAVTNPTALVAKTRNDGFGLNYANGAVSFTLARGADVSLSLVNLMGQNIANLHSGRLSEGSHKFTTPAALPQGVYWLVLKDASSHTLGVKKLVKF